MEGIVQGRELNIMNGFNFVLKFSNSDFDFTMGAMSITGLGMSASLDERYEMSNSTVKKYVNSMLDLEATISRGAFEGEHELFELFSKQHSGEIKGAVKDRYTLTIDIYNRTHTKIVRTLKVTGVIIVSLMVGDLSALEGIILIENIGFRYDDIEIV